MSRPRPPLGGAVETVIRKYLPKFAVLVPALFLCRLTGFYGNIFITPIHLWVDGRVYVWGAVLITVLWLGCPGKRRLARSPLTETAACLLPVAVCAFPVFWEWHFAAGLLLLAAVAVLALGTLRRNRRLRRKAGEGLLLVCATALLLPPAFLAWFVYDLKSPVYTAYQELLEPASGPGEEGGQAEEGGDLLKEQLQALQGFREDRWRKLSVRERTALLQTLVDLEARELSIPRTPVLVEPLASRVMLGHYDPDRNEIRLNTETVMEDTAEDAVHAALHETAHAYCSFLTANFDFASPVAACPYFDILRGWKENQESYDTAERAGFDTYASQPLEREAEAFAGREATRLFALLD